MDDIMKERIKRLNDAIRQSGLSYSELQAKTGIARSSIQRYATFKTEKIPIDNMEKLAAATGVPIEYIMCWTDEDEKSAPEDKLKSAIIEKINHLSDSQLDRLLGYLEALSEK